MDAKELRGLAEQLAKSILENKNVEATIFQLVRVISYLESEQNERRKLTEAMQELKAELFGDEDQVGIAHRLEAIEERGKRNAKMLALVLASVMGSLVLTGLKLVAPHLK